MDIEDKLKAVFAEVFEMDANTVGSNTKLKEIKGWDSLGQLRIIMAIEEAFDVSFTIEEIALLVDYESILNKVQSKVNF